jgi:putative ABC transport system permease protein
VRAQNKLRLRLRSLFVRRHVERELETELRLHLDQLTEENIAGGMSPDEARRMAQLTMGNVAHFQEECRDMRRVNYIDDLIRDLRYAGRNLRRSPGFAALAVLIMALGIGANTAVFSVVNAVLLKPLSYRDPDRIVTLTNLSTLREGPTALSKQVSIPDVLDWQRQSTAFEAIAYYTSRETPVVRGTTAEYARLATVSPEFFRVFGVEPLAGRFFTPEEMKQGAGGAAMISYAYWQSRFGGDPNALGQTIRAAGQRPIVGVLPPGFRFPNNDTDVWVSMVGPPGNRGGLNWVAAGKLKPGVSLERAQTEMTSISARLEELYPDSNRGRRVAVTQMREELVGNVRFTLYLLLGAVGVVLLIACANTATLLLGKATARAREIGVRAAIGASRPRIVRQLVAESLLLAFVAGALGLLLAYGGSNALVKLAPADVPRLGETAVDRWVLAFTMGMSILTSLLFGLVPAIYASKIELSEALKQGATRVVGGASVRLRGALAVAEIALAVMLVSGAGLLIKSFLALHNVALGFRPENVLVMRASVPAAPSVGIVRARQFFKDTLSRVAGLPGVLAAGATMAPPGSVESTGTYFVDQMPAKLDPSAAPPAILSVVAPGTFAALGIPLRSGRDFNDDDALDRPFVAVVNEALARKAFPNQNPLGRTVFSPFDSFKGMTIVGVVGDVRQRGPEREPMAEFYMPYSQHGFNGATLSLVVRTAGDPNALAETVRRLARERAPDVAMRFTTMENLLSENVAAPRFRTLLLAVFAGLAVCLAMAGVYGVMAYAVGQRSSEVGLRMALGASTGSVLRLILGQGLTLAGIGLALGLAGAFAGSRLLTTMLFQVKPTDPLVYLAVAILLGVVALVASYIPARRASRIDPVAAIRQE